LPSGRTADQQNAALGFRPTGRLKTIATTVEKLRRERSFRLKTVQDLAGARVTVPGDLSDQDRAVDGFRDRCATAGAATSVIDRRSDPRAGYRAVHVVVRIDGMPVEVRFRTELQNLWAQTSERLADHVGRQIRSGGDPADGADTTERPPNGGNWRRRRCKPAKFWPSTKRLRLPTRSVTPGLGWSGDIRALPQASAPRQIIALVAQAIDREGRRL
jgi:hypothetical protein